MIFLSKKAFVIVIFSMLVSANLSAYERCESYIVRKMQIFPSRIFLRLKKQTSR